MAKAAHHFVITIRATNGSGGMEVFMKNHTTILDPLLKVNSKLNAIAKTPKDFGTEDLLYASEIHTIVAIGKNPGYNLTQIAEILGVTKSAVSKFVKKLQKKNYIMKRKVNGDNREFMLHLTDKGRVALRGHEIFKETMFEEVNIIIKNTKKEEHAIIESFLNNVYKALP